MKSRTQKSDLRTDPLFLDREEELRQLLDNLKLRRHTLLLGEKGTGKTALMRQAMAHLDGTMHKLDFADRMTHLRTGRLTSGQRGRSVKPLFITHVSPLGDLLRELASLLWKEDLLLSPAELRQERDWEKVKKHFTARGRIAQAECIIESLAHLPARQLVFLDSLDRISPGHIQFLESLFDVAVVCGGVVRQKEGYQFKKVWSSFSRIDVGPLPDEFCRELIRQFSDTYGISVVDRDLYERELLKACNGNPFHIRTQLWHGARQRHLRVSDIRSLRRLEEGEYFNMGPVYIFGASAFTLFKIFSLGMDNREFYIYFSALGFVVYLTFRVFRTFFLFRPQRWGR